MIFHRILDFQAFLDSLEFSNQVLSGLGGEPSPTGRYSSHLLEVRSGWYCWLGGWVRAKVLENGSNDFSDFLHEVRGP